MGINPAAGVVAGVAGRTGANVIRRFSRGIDAVMAAGTTAAYFIVVNSEGCRPADGGVACVAAIAAENMAA